MNDGKFRYHICMERRVAYNYRASEPSKKLESKKYLILASFQNFGIYQGRTRDEFRKELRRLHKKAKNFTPPGGEDVQAVS